MDETPFTRKPTLRGELVTLRPIRRDDADTIGRIIQDDEIARLTGSVSSSEEKVNVETERFRDVYEAWSRADDRLVLGIVDNATGDLVGEAVLHGWDRYNHSCNFRTFVAADRHGRVGSRYPAVDRSPVQVGADPVSFLASGCNESTNTGFGLSAFCNHGESRNLHFSTFFSNFGWR